MCLLLSRPSLWAVLGKTYTHTNMCVYIYLSLHTHIYKNTHISIYIHIQMYVYIIIEYTIHICYICICMFIYTYIQYIDTHTVHQSLALFRPASFHICNSPPTVRKTWLPLSSIYLLNPLVCNRFSNHTSCLLGSQPCCHLQGRGREREGAEGRGGGFQALCKLALHSIPTSPASAGPDHCLPGLSLASSRSLLPASVSSVLHSFWLPRVSFLSIL